MASVLFNSNFSFSALPTTPCRRTSFDRRPSSDANVSPRAKIPRGHGKRQHHRSSSKGLPTSEQAHPIGTSCPFTTGGNVASAKNKSNRRGKPGRDDGRTEHLSGSASALVKRAQPPDGRSVHQQKSPFPLYRPHPGRTRDVRRPPPLNLGTLVGATPQCPLPPPVDIPTVKVTPDEGPSRKNEGTCREKPDPEAVGLQLLLHTLSGYGTDDETDAEVAHEEDQDPHFNVLLEGHHLFHDPRTDLNLVRSRVVDTAMPAIMEGHESETGSTSSRTLSISSGPSTPNSGISPSPLLRKNSSSSTVPTSVSANSFSNDIYYEKAISPKTRDSFWWNENEAPQFDFGDLLSPLPSARTPTSLLDGASPASSRRSSVATFFCRGSRPSIAFRNPRFSLGLGSIADSQIDLESCADDMAVYSDVDDLKKHVTMMCATQPVNLDPPALDDTDGEESEEESYHRQLSIITRFSSRTSETSRKMSTDSRKMSIDTRTMPDSSRRPSFMHPFRSAKLPAEDARRPWFDVRADVRSPSAFDFRRPSMEARAPPLARKSIDHGMHATFAPRKSSLAEARNFVYHAPPMHPALLSVATPEAALTGPVVSYPKRARTRRRTASSECIVAEVMEKFRTPQSPLEIGDPLSPQTTIQTMSERGHELSPQDTIKAPVSNRLEDENSLQDTIKARPRTQTAQPSQQDTMKAIPTPQSSPQKLVKVSPVVPSATEIVPDTSDELTPIAKPKASILSQIIDSAEKDVEARSIRSSVSGMIAGLHNLGQEERPVEKTSRRSQLQKSFTSRFKPAEKQTGGMKKARSFTDLFKRSNQDAVSLDLPRLTKRRSFMSDRSIAMSIASKCTDMTGRILRKKSSFLSTSEAGKSDAGAVDDIISAYSLDLLHRPADGNLTLLDFDIPAVDSEWGGLM